MGNVFMHFTLRLSSTGVQMVFQVPTHVLQKKHSGRKCKYAQLQLSNLSYQTASVQVLVLLKKQSLYKPLFGVLFIYRQTFLVSQNGKPTPQLYGVLHFSYVSCLSIVLYRSILLHHTINLLLCN